MSEIFPNVQIQTGPIQEPKIQIAEEIMLDKSFELSPIKKKQMKVTFPPLPGSGMEEEAVKLKKKVQNFERFSSPKKVKTQKEEDLEYLSSYINSFKKPVKPTSSQIKPQNRLTPANRLEIQSENLNSNQPPEDDGNRTPYTENMAMVKTGRT